jgi:hypothetical protein
MNYVWYASYGSNLMSQRFLSYIKGGRPPGSLREETGCRDRTLPRADKPISIPYPLYFSCHSQRWSGGVAFLSHEQEAVSTLGRMYLITDQQFFDVMRQENGMAKMNVDVHKLRLTGSQQVSSSWYGKIIYLNDTDGYPVLTFTATRPFSPDIVNPPSLGYLEVIATGLRETYGLSGPEIARYLADKPGIHGHYSQQELSIL